MVTPTVQPETTHGVQKTEVVLVRVGPKPVQLHDLNVIHVELVVPLRVILPNELLQYLGPARMDVLHPHVHEGVLPEVLHCSWQVREEVREGVDVAPLVHRRNGINGHVRGEVAVCVQGHGVLKVPENRLQEDGTAAEAAHPAVTQGPLHLAKHGAARGVLCDHVRKVEVVVHVGKPDAVLRCMDDLLAVVLRESVVEDDHRVIEPPVEPPPEPRERVPDVRDVIRVVGREVVQHSSEIPRQVQAARIDLLAEGSTIGWEALAETAHAPSSTAGLQEVSHSGDLDGLLN
mmetsp:Transcript_111611/g.349109  ORF Transcript_111611/g.349109 Transcript_111611/m.349109 type:complete len:289 (-) Transcript_111611:110-976(-)